MGYGISHTRALWQQELYKTHSPCSRLGKSASSFKDLPLSLAEKMHNRAWKHCDIPDIPELNCSAVHVHSEAVHQLKKQLSLKDVLDSCHYLNLMRAQFPQQKIPWEKKKKQHFRSLAMIACCIYLVSGADRNYLRNEIRILFPSGLWHSRHCGLWALSTDDHINCVTSDWQFWLHTISQQHKPKLLVFESVSKFGKKAEHKAVSLCCYAK